MINVKLIIILLILTFISFVYAGLKPNPDPVLRVLIKKTLEKIEKELQGYMVIKDSGIAGVNYGLIYSYAKGIIGDKEKLEFEPYLTQKLIIGIHYRENHSNIKYNPTNGDGVFQLDRMYSKIVGNPGFYCTSKENYEKVYKSCTLEKPCKDFTYNLAYQYCDYVQYMRHKFKWKDIQKEAIYGRKWRGMHIKGLYDILRKHNIYVDKEILDLLLKSLKHNKIKVIDYTTANFLFVANDYGIKDFNDFVDYFQKKYLSGYDKKFVRMLFEAFQDAVVFTYYNGLGATHGSWITKSYVINIPTSFAPTLGVKPFVSKKPSGRGYDVYDAQVGALVRYFYVDKPDYLKYLLLFIDTFLR